MVPTPPIFVIDRESGDVVWAFSDVVAAQGAMEPPEVNENAYLVLDGLGREATLGVNRWDTTIDSWSTEPDPGQLRELLSAYLAQQGHAVEPGTGVDLIVADAFRVATEVELNRTRPRFLIPVARWLRSRHSSSET